MLSEKFNAGDRVMINNGAGKDTVGTVVGKRESSTLDVELDRALALIGTPDTGPRVWIKWDESTYVSWMPEQQCQLKDTALVEKLEIALEAANDELKALAASGTKVQQITLDRIAIALQEIDDAGY